MKRFLIIGAIALLFTQCAEEIDLEGDLKSVPVVYCLLDLNSDNQLVRISRTWLPDPENPSLSAAADSLIISEPAEVYIEKWVENVPEGNYLRIYFTIQPEDPGQPVGK